MRSRGVRHAFELAGASRTAEGTGDDYGTLLARHWGPLVGFATSILRSDESSEDIVQSAFVRLWEERTPREAEHEVAWLYRTVRHLALNERRWRRVRATWRAQVLAQARLAPEPDEEEANEPRVRSAVAALPRRRREVFELARFHGLSYRQIATALSLSPQTVANHMSAALRDLRVALGDLLQEVDEARDHEHEAGEARDIHTSGGERGAR
ncbi:MAG: sigma-70 family RNA polymerase sigma factor [Gemmatimonadota bacterium]